MPNYNQAILIGHLCADPEVRYTAKETAITSARIAVTKTWKNDRGEKMEKTSFIELSIWGQSGERFAEWLKKGRAVFVSGSLDQDEWDDKDTGKKRSKLFVTVDEWKPLGEFPKREDAQPARRESRPPETRRPPQEPDLDPDDSDDMPFSNEAHVPR